jgi:hypothetical protein
MELDFDRIKEKLLLPDILQGVDEDLLAIAFTHPSGTSSWPEDVLLRWKGKYKW